MENHFNKDFLVIYLRVVQGCNLNCAHCFTLGDRDPYKLIDLKYVTSFLKQIKIKINPKKATVYIHGGETFLAPLGHLAEINKIIKKELRDTLVNIIPQTNLMYEINEEYIDFIKNEYSCEMGVSWDYKIRFKKEGSHLDENLFFKNLKKLTKEQINLSVAITVQKYLLDCDVAELLPRFNGVKSLDFELLTIFDEKTKKLKVNNEEWSDFYFKIVDYYSRHKTTWSLPQVDLFTKSVLENKIFNCKCNCCQHRTLTLNCNGTIGLCPDDAYVNPLSDIEEFEFNWNSFKEKSLHAHLKYLAQELQPMCANCDFLDLCGGNCEQALFNEDDNECPLSKKVLKHQKENLHLFEKKLQEAKFNLIELKQ